MLIKVGQHKCEIEKSPVNELEVNVTKVRFEFDPVMDDLVKEAYFTLDGHTYKQIIENDECDIPSEVLVKKGQVTIGVVAFEVEGQTTLTRYNPSPAYISTLEGSLKTADNTEPITPSEMEQFEQALQEGLDELSEAVGQAENLNITSERVEDGVEITTTDKTGTTVTSKVNDGEKGEDGKNGSDAKINGVNTITIEAGENITLEQEGDTLTINSTGGGTEDYEDLENLPTINNVELKGNKSLSDLGAQPAGNYLTEETDPVFTESPAHDITSQDITNWNNKSDFSGNYNDLSNKPDLSNFITKSVNDLTYYTLATNTGSTIELTLNSSTYVVTLNLKNSAGTTISTNTIDLPLESVVVNGSYDSTNKKIVLTLQNGNTIDVPVGDLISGLQTEITNNNKLSSDLVDDTNHTNKFVTASDKTTWSGKQDKIVAGTNISIASDGKTISATDTTYSDATTGASGLMSASDKTKLNGIASGAEVNVQANWNETDTSSDAYIQNKPTIPTVNNSTITIQMNGSTVDSFTTNASSGKTINLGTVITSHQDISGKQDVIDSSHKLSADLISDGTTNKTVTSTEKNTWNNKQDALVSGTNIKTINNTSLLGSGNISISSVEAAVLNTYGNSTLDALSQEFVTSKIAEVTDLYIPFASLTWESGYLNQDGTVTEHAALKNAEIPVVGGTTFSYTNLRTASKSSYPIICFYDRNRTFISYVSATASNEYLDGIADVPNNASYAKVSTYYNTSYPVNITTKQYSDKIQRIDTDLSNLSSDVSSYNDILYTKKYQTLFYRTAKPNLTAGYYLDKDGVVTANVNCAITDYIEVIPNSTIYYNLFEVGRTTSAVCIYDANKNFLSSIRYDTSTYDWVFVNGNSVLPANAKYVRLGFCQRDEWSDAWKQFFAFSERVPLNDFLDNQWNGKKWCAFGTSLTDMSTSIGLDNVPTGKYVQFLANNSGLILDNKGKSGGTISDGGIHTSTGNILSGILNTDVSSYDLITLEGFVNDFAAAVPIGQITDTVSTTLCGAIYQAVTYLLNNSDALVCLITDSTGQQYTLQSGVADYRRTKLNSGNNTQLEFNQAIIRMGQYLGVPVIDVGGKSMVGENKTEYLSDHIHHSVLGGEQYAQTIWNELKSLHPEKTS